MTMIGPLMCDLEGLELTSKEIELIQHPFVGGIILFSRNCESPEQVLQLTTAIRKIKPNILIAVDQEGGRVQRLQHGFTRLPSANNIGQLYNKDPQQACVVAEAFGWLMATEVLAVGIDFSFAPVLDLDKNLSAVIGDRAFHSKSDSIVKLAEHFIAGMHKAGMAATGKHFPGHGSVAPDSHINLPIDERSLTEIEQDDIIPFQKLIPKYLDSIMPAHIVFPKIDDKPVCFSEHWLQDILRKDLHFDGVIFSDDLSMEGAKIINGCFERVSLALKAGCDMILICNDRDSVEEVLRGLSDCPLAFATKNRLLRMKGKSKLSWNALSGDNDWQRARDVVATVLA
jgi:beta-N-acetylhexosaminidase